MPVDTTAKRNSILAALADGPLDRQSISDRTGLTYQTVYYLTADLVARREVHVTGKRGQHQRVHLGNGDQPPNLDEVVNARDYAVLRQPTQGGEIVRFGSAWKPGRGLSNRTPGKLAACSLVNVYG